MSSKKKRLKHLQKNTLQTMHIHNIERQEYKKMTIAHLHNCGVYKYAATSKGYITKHELNGNG